MGSFSLTPEELRLLSSLNAYKIRFIIVGLTSAVIQGSHVVTQDVDLWIENLGSEKYLEAIKAAGAVYIPPGIVGLNPPMLAPAAFRIFDIVTTLSGLSEFAIEYNNALPITLQGIPVKILPLDRIIVSKEAANREKDRAVLPALKASLEVIKKS